MANNSDFIFNEFKNITHEPTSFSAVVKQEWDPKFFNDRSNLRYSIQVLSNETLLNLWAETLEALKTGFSPKTVLSMVKIAFQLKNPDDSTKTIGLTGHYKGAGADITVFAPETNLSNIKYPKAAIGGLTIDPDVGANVSEPTTEINNQAYQQNDVLVSAPYLCCSMLRLLKKDPASFILSLDNIRKNFNQFYKIPSLVVNTFNIDKPTANVLSDVLQNDIVLTNTIIYHLNAMASPLNPQANAAGLVRYLLAQHLEFKGLTPYRLFVDCYKHVKKELSTPVFLSWLMSDSTEKGVLCLADMVQRFDDPAAPADRGFFAYARYLLPGSFFDIHINNSPVLAYALGVLAKELTQEETTDVATKKQNDPLQIAAFKKINTLDKKEGKDLAMMFLTCLKERKQVHKKAGVVQQRVQEETYGIKRKYTNGILDTPNANTYNAPTGPTGMDHDAEDDLPSGPAEKRPRVDNSDAEALLATLGQM